MAYVRKTRDRWDIETNYGYGWDVECSEYTWEEAKEQLRTYRANITGLVRLKKHREPISKYPVGHEEIRTKVVHEEEPDFIGGAPNYDKFEGWTTEEVLVWLNID